MVLVAVIAAITTTAQASYAGNQGGRGEGERPAPRLHSTGPPLIALPRKIADAQWLVAWLLRPQRLRRHSRMRRLNLSIEEARAVAAYLYPALPPPSPPAQWRGGDEGTGSRLFVTRGCRGCHVLPGTGRSTLANVPDLDGIGLKVRGDWLFEWLKSPRSYDPTTAMPQLILSDQEIRHLVAYLMSQRQGADGLAAVPRSELWAAPDVARAAIVRFDCAKCHLMRDFQTVEPIPYAGTLPRGCGNCHQPGSPAPRMPAGESGQRAALWSGRLLVDYYGCRGCHRLGGEGGGIADHLERRTLAPPSLDGIGARVQKSWLIGYLQQPRPLRAWLKIRMPDYGFAEQEAKTLAEYLAALADVPAADERGDIVPPSAGEWPAGH